MFGDRFVNAFCDSLEYFKKSSSFTHGELVEKLENDRKWRVRKKELEAELETTSSVMRRCELKYYLKNKKNGV